MLKKLWIRYCLRNRITHISEELRLIKKQSKRLVNRPKLKDIPEKLEAFEQLYKQKKILKRLKAILAVRLYEIRTFS